MQAARPGQTSTGKQDQYRKHIARLLKYKGLTTEMAQDKNHWRVKLSEVELYPRMNEAKNKQNRGDIPGAIPPQITTIQ